MHDPSQAAAAATSRVRLFGRRDSAEAWELRNFLKRSVVEFDWVELVGDEAPSSGVSPNDA